MATITRISPVSDAVSEAEVYEAKWTVALKAAYVKAHPENCAGPDELALQAGLCYNKLIKLWWSSGAGNTLDLMKGLAFMGDTVSSSSHVRKLCANPTCGKSIDRRSTYCVAHAPRPRPTSEAIAKRAASNTGKKRSPEVCAKMSASNKLSANTPEGRANRSKAAKSQAVNPFAGHTHTAETKAIIKGKRANQTFSDETCKKLSQSHMGLPAWNKGAQQSDEVKSKISATLLSKREHLSQKGKERYAHETEEQHEKRLTPWIEASQKKEYTSIEVYVARWLDILGIEYETQKQIGYYVADFYIPSRNTVLEVNGCHWHGCEPCGFNSEWHKKKHITDKRRAVYLKNKGYTLQVVWEHRIRRMMQQLQMEGMVC